MFKAKIRMYNIIKIAFKLSLNLEKSKILIITFGWCFEKVVFKTVKTNLWQP